jgi:mannosyl-3-phosphoglycerate phosphatase
MNLMVFTDLDGTLLDHDDYSYEAAQEGLERIRYQQIPLVFTSSKTRLEIERLQAAMQIREPFISENGAAIFFPDGYRNFKLDAGFRRPPYTVIQLGATYSEIRRFVYSVKERFSLKGFGDLLIRALIFRHIREHRSIPDV